MSRTFWYGFFVAVLTFVAIERARTADVMPIWQNDTVANSLSFNDTFGHQVGVGTYNPSTGLFTASMGSISIGATFTGGLLSVGGSPAANGGTLAFTVAGNSGGIPYFSGATTWASSAVLVANQIVLGGGAGVAPSTPVGLGTTTQLLHGNASGAPSFAAISVADITTALASPPCIGCTAPAAGAFTTLSATGAVSGAGITALFAAPPPFGSTTPNTIASTILTASSSNGGYLSTTIDSRNNNTNGILVSGASTTQAQELTQSPVQISWHPGFTGSPGGTFNTAGLTVTTTSTVNDQIYPWGIIGIVKNFTDLATTGNPNAVAINGTTFTEPVTASSSSSSWGANFVIDESNAAGITNPTAYRVGTEIDVYLNASDTTDTGLKRIGLLVSATPIAPNTAVHGGAAIDVSPGNGTEDYGILFFPPNAATGNITNIISNSLTAGHFSFFLVSVGFAVDNTGFVTVAGIQDNAVSANASVATVLGSVGPAGSHTTVQEWLQIKGTGGAVRYVPGF